VENGATRGKMLASELPQPFGVRRTVDSAGSLVSGVLHLPVLLTPALLVLQSVTLEHTRAL
jgi:hypothetical protein